MGTCHRGQTTSQASWKGGWKSREERLERCLRWVYTRPDPGARSCGSPGSVELPGLANPNTKQPRRRLPRRDTGMSPQLLARLPEGSLLTPRQRGRGVLAAGEGAADMPLESSRVHVSAGETRQGCLYST